MTDPIAPAIGPKLLSDYLSLPVARPQYICSPILPHGRIVLFVGNSTQGKTPFGHQLARDMAAGNAVLDYFPCSAPCRVGYIDAESSEEDVSLRAQMQEHRTADTGDRLIIRNRQQVYNEGLSLTGAGRERLCAFAERNALDLLMLDNLFSLSGGLDVTKGNVLQPILTGLKRITDRPNHPSVMLFHHPRKGGPDEKRISILSPDFMRWLEEASGSLVLINLTDVRLGIERVEVHGEEMTVLRGRSRVPGEEQDIGPLYLDVDEEHALATIDRRPELLQEQGPKLAAVLEEMRKLGCFTLQQAISGCVRLPLSPSAKTVRRALRFAREHGFVDETATPGVFQWR